MTAAQRETTEPGPLVTCTLVDGVAQVRLNRSDKLNALTLPLLRELRDTARMLHGDRTLRAVVLAGEGGTFSAGLDFASVARDRRGLLRAFVPSPWQGTNLFQECCVAWRRLPVPVIAAVEGHCLGGGLQVALAADFRVAAPDSRWSVLEGKWGLIPDMSGVATLKELVGIDTAKLLTMTARTVTGEEAHRLGLVTVVDPDPLGAAQALAEELGRRSPDALAAAKALFQRTWTASLRRTFAAERVAQLALLRGANHHAARRAATARTQPVFGPRARR
jgi:enoyl-CoA hydratase/carnithine racemase